MREMGDRPTFWAYLLPSVFQVWKAYMEKKKQERHLTLYLREVSFLVRSLGQAGLEMGFLKNELNEFC
jgi:hypothetical protein